jgi:hypothetical protein
LGIILFQSLVQGRCVAAKKKRERKNKTKKQKRFLQFKKILLLKQKKEQKTKKIEREDDVDINTSNTSTPTHNQISGPITWARACQLNNQVSSFLASYLSYLDNGNMCFVLLLRNDGHERNGVAFTLASFGF